MPKKHHDLKSYPLKFGPVINGSKTFEIRRNDRQYEPGDTFTLHEHFYDKGDVYTGRTVSGTVGHVDTYAQAHGIVVFSLLNVGLMIVEGAVNTNEEKGNDTDTL